MCFATCFRTTICSRRPNSCFRASQIFSRFSHRFRGRGQRCFTSLCSACLHALFFLVLRSACSNFRRWVLSVRQQAGMEEWVDKGRPRGIAKHDQTTPLAFEFEDGDLACESLRARCPWRPLRYLVPSHPRLAASRTPHATFRSSSAADFLCGPRITATISPTAYILVAS